MADPQPGQTARIEESNLEAEELDIIFQRSVDDTLPLIQRLVSDWLAFLPSDISPQSLPTVIAAGTILASETDDLQFIDSVEAVEATLFDLLMISDLLGRAQFLAARDQIEFAEAGIDFNLTPDEALAFLRSKIPLTRAEFNQLDAIYRQRAFTVAGISSLDVLNRIKDILIDNLEQGGTLRDFRINLVDFLTTAGIHGSSRWRIETIYRTNSQAAYNAGRIAQIKQFSDEFPLMEYVAVLDDRTSAIDQHLSGVVKPVHDPFWDVYTPPNHFNCRGTVRALSTVEIDDLGIKPTRGSPRLDPDKGFDASPVDLIKTIPQSMKKRARVYRLKIDQKKTQSPGPRPTTLKQLESTISELQNDFVGDKQQIRRIRWNMRRRNLRGAWNSDSKEILIHRDVRKDLLSGIKKLNKQQQITFNEIEALRTLWHEINHSRGNQNFDGYRQQRARMFEIEVVNEIHSRLTLDRFIGELGYDSKLADPQRAHVRLAQGYHWWVNDMIDIFERVGVTRTEATRFFEDLNYNQNTNTYLAQIAELTGKRLGLNKSQRRKLLNSALTDLEKTGSVKAFAAKVKQLAEDGDVEAVSWTRKN